MQCAIIVSDCLMEGFRDTNDEDLLDVLSAIVAALVQVRGEGQCFRDQMQEHRGEGGTHCAALHRGGTRALCSVDALSC